MRLFFAALLLVGFACSQEENVSIPESQLAIPKNANKAYQVIKESTANDSKVVFYASLVRSMKQITFLYYLNASLFDNAQGFDLTPNDRIYSSEDLALSTISNEKNGHVFVTDLTNQELRINDFGRTEACTILFLWRWTNDSLWPLSCFKNLCI